MVIGFDPHQFNSTFYFSSHLINLIQQIINFHLCNGNETNDWIDWLVEQHFFSSAANPIKQQTNQTRNGSSWTGMDCWWRLIVCGLLWVIGRRPISAETLHFKQTSFVFHFSFLGWIGELKREEQTPLIKVKLSSGLMSGIGVKTYNPLRRIMKSEALQWRRQCPWAINHNQLHQIKN